MTYRTIFPGGQCCKYTGTAITTNVVFATLPDLFALAHFPSGNSMTISELEFIQFHF